MNGDNGSPYNSTAPVAIDSGDPVYVSVLYDGATGYVTLNQTNTIGVALTFTTNLPIGSLSAILGADTAYVGFAGGTGGVNANQTVRDFVYLPLPTLTVQQTGPTSVMLSWPTSIAGYSLQTSPAVSPTSWTAVGAPVSRVGDQYQVTVSPLTTYQFFRLVITDTSP